MAISFIGSASGNAANGTDVTLTFPGGVQQNDLVIVAYSIGDNDGVDFNMAMITAGYTEVADLHADDTTDCDLGVYWKVMGATPDTSAVVDGLGGNDAGVAAVCMIFRGVDTSTPMDVAAQPATGIDTNRPDPPSIDWVNAGTWTVAVGACSSASATGATMTAPANYTTNAVSTSGDDTTDTIIGIGYRSSPADPENPGAFTPSIADSANDAWCAVTLALRQAVVAADPVESRGRPYGWLGQRQMTQLIAQ